MNSLHILKSSLLQAKILVISQQKVGIKMVLLYRLQQNISDELYSIWSNCFISS